MEKILEVRDLVVSFYTYAGVVKALKGIDLDVRRGETFGIVGETGCGKSVTSLSILMLVPSPGEIEAGEILLERGNGYDDLTKLSERELREIRGGEISMVFQEPGEALNPVYTIGEQISEAFLVHQLEDLARESLKGIERDLEDSNPIRRFILRFERKLYRKMLTDPDSIVLRILSKIPLVGRYRGRLEDEAGRRAIQMLRTVGIPDPKDVAEKHPHELSGGMAQRAVISMALACRPKLLIADEPTSNLDVSIQSRILDLLNDFKEEYDLSILYITHDLGVVAETCDRAGVMYAGGIVEIAEVEELYEKPLHPYTKLLLRAVPSPEKESLQSIGGSVPDLISPPSGCRFHPRCPRATEICSEEDPHLEEVEAGHQVACHNWEGSDEDFT